METLARAANRGSVPTGYEIENSVKLEADNTEYFSRTPGSATNRQTFTFSTWVKRTELGLNSMFIDVRANSTSWTVLGFDTNDRIVVYSIEGVTDYGYQYTPRYRDTSAWYHIVWKSDITNATAANRWQVYVNGVEITDKDVDYGTPPTDFSTLINSTNLTTVGYNSDSSNSASQYMAETHLIDGIALAPTEFGEYDEDTGIWKPKAYTGSYGYDINHTGGFYLNFKSSGSLGADSSGNGNNFTLNNITSVDQATDTPTNNFCTLNVLNNKYLTITEGATKSVESTDSVWYGCTTTIGVNNGKWYSEGKAIAIGTGIFFGVTPFNGTADASIGMGSSVFPGNVADTMGYWNGGGGQVYRDNSVVATIGAFAANDIIGIALDMDNGYVYFAKNGTWLNSGNPTSGATGTGGFSLLNPTETHGFAFGLKNSTAGINLSGYKVYTPSSAASDANGYGTFEYAPPSGYYALCTKNLAEYG